tara:strand:+ start:59 stop:334 length:276 start_codon:yes stop_codon:yes gene_type:complete
MEIDRVTVVVHWKITATAEILAAQKQIITIAILIHGRIIVATGTPVTLMETNTVNIATHRQLITIEKDLMTAVLMRVAVKTAIVHLVLITE